MNPNHKSISFDPQETTGAPPRGQSYIFAIGINKYQHCSPLFNAVKDVKEVVHLLTGRYQFEKENVTVLVDEQATRSNIFKALDHFTEIITEHDRLLIYFSGHGTYKGNIKEGFWIPVEGNLNDPGGFIPNSTIVKYLKAINSLHTFVVSDACFSGALFMEERKFDHKQRQENIPSRWLMTSGRNEPVLDGLPGQNSPFADSLLLHLKNNKEGILPVTSLYSDILEDVGSNFEQMPRCEPLQGVGHRGGEFMLRLKGLEQPYTYIPQPEPVATTVPMPPPAPVWKRYLLPTSVALVALLTLYLIFPNGGDSDTAAEKARIKAVLSYIDLGQITAGDTKPFQFTVLNEGKAEAKLDPVSIPCDYIQVTSNDTATLKARGIKIYGAQCVSGSATGLQRCTLSVRGSNVEQAISIVVEAEIVEKETAVADTSTTPDPTSPNQKKVENPPKKGNNTEGKTPKKDEVKTPPTKKEDATEIPAKSAEQEFCTVRCLTYGTPGIKIWFYGKDGKPYEKVSTSASDVSFRVPCSMIGKIVEVNFARDGKPDDHGDVQLNSSDPFEVPRSIRIN